MKRRPTKPASKPAPKATKRAPEPASKPASKRWRSFERVVEVNDPTPAQAAARERAAVYQNRRGGTALCLSREDGVARYIPHAETGLAVYQVPAADLDAGWKPLEDYPPERAARLYASFARLIGASEEALDALATLVDVAPEERTNALARGVRDRSTATREVRRPAGDASKPAPRAAGGSKPASRAPRAPRAAGGRTAAAAFRELILAGKKTDAEIFKIVQAEFKLDDSKRGYVRWYRNDLRKKGANPPDEVTK